MGIVDEEVPRFVLNARTETKVSLARATSRFKVRYNTLANGSPVFDKLKSYMRREGLEAEIVK